jgi:hypothetical protein
MKTVLCVLAAMAILTTSNAAVAQSSWRDQRALGDWRNNTWREQRFDQDWRNEGWRRDRANQDWQSREDYLRQRMPNNATDTGATPPTAESKITPPEPEETCTAIERQADGTCPDETAAAPAPGDAAPAAGAAATTPTNPVITPPKVTDRPGGK